MKALVVSDGVFGCIFVWWTLSLTLLHDDVSYRWLMTPLNSFYLVAALGLYCVISRVVFKLIAHKWGGTGRINNGRDAGFFGFLVLALSWLIFQFVLCFLKNDLDPLCDFPPPPSRYSGPLTFLRDSAMFSNHFATLFIILPLTLIGAFESRPRPVLRFIVLGAVTSAVVVTGSYFLGGKLLWYLTIKAEDELVTGFLFVGGNLLYAVFSVIFANLGLRYMSANKITLCGHLRNALRGNKAVKVSTPATSQADLPRPSDPSAVQTRP